MSFHIRGLPLETFRPLFGLSDMALAERGMRRVPVTAPRTAPCRITLDDAAPGEHVILLNWEHQGEATPFRARHAIYVREAEAETFDRADEVPPALRARTLSVRAFDAEHMMIQAALCEGVVLDVLLDDWFARDEIAYVHVHYAARGCFAARADRG